MKTRIICSSLLLALAVTSFANAQDPNSRRRLGILGGLGGAAIGAAIGEDKGDAVPGALIGGAIGLIGGAAAGNAIDQQDYRNRAYQSAAIQQQAQIQAQAVTLGDVVSMTQAGLSDAVIISHIQAHGVAQRLTANDLIVLKQQGVCDAVINAMQNGPAARPVTIQAQPSPVVVREHYYTRPAPVYWHDAHYDYHHHHHRRHYGNSGVHFSFGH